MKTAITGGIGSGKSTVADIIAKQGYKVFSCDGIYSELLDTSDELRDKLFAAFDGIRTPGGEVDRRALSAMVFEDSAKRELLDSITHPVIMAELVRRMEREPISFAEVPLLFEGGFESMFDKVIVIVRDEEERIDAIMKRSGLTHEEAEARVKSQNDYSKSDFEQYYVICNNGSIEDLVDKTMATLIDVTSSD